MKDRDNRTIKLIGEDGMDKLRKATIMIVGIGGVGSYAAEAIARAGVGRIIVMDGDVVAESNLNRQLVALASTVGRNKAEVMAERIRDINPGCDVTAVPGFFGRDSGADGGLSLCRIIDSVNVSPDWVIDAIDDVDAKVRMIKEATQQGIRIVSAMGAASKMETHFIASDIAGTTVCPLAKVMRKRLRDEGIEHLPVVYSTEKPIRCERDGNSTDSGLGSISYVPGSMGLELAGYVIKELIK